MWLFPDHWKDHDEGAHGGSTLVATCECGKLRRENQNSRVQRTRPVAPPPTETAIETLPPGTHPLTTQVERPDDPLGQIGVGSTYLSDSGVWPIRVQVPADTSQNCTRVHPPLISASPGVFY